MAGQMGVRIVNIVIEPQAIASLGVIKGFFSLNWQTNTGYEQVPIVGYSTQDTGTLLLSGYDGNTAWFDEDNNLNVKNPASNSAMRLLGVVLNGNS